MREQDKAVAGVFKKFAEADGKSMSEIAREMGISRELVRRSFTGTRSIRPSEFIELCRILDLSLDDFAEVV